MASACTRPANRLARTNRLAAKPARTCSSTPTTRSTGTPWGAEALEPGAEPRTGRSSCRSATRPATGATSWSASRSRTTRRRSCMNADFVSIKVDREERPDLDAIYMDAVQQMTGHGGWPMSVFLTPDGQALLRRHVLPRRSRATACLRSARCSTGVAEAGASDAPRSRRRARVAEPIARSTDAEHCAAAGGRRPLAVGRGQLDTALLARSSATSTTATAAGAARPSSRSR